MAIALALVVGGVASLASGAMGASAAKDAAGQQQQAARDASNTQLTATRESIAAQEKALAQSRADLAPYRLGGNEALKNYMSLLGLPVTQGMFNSGGAGTGGGGLPGQTMLAAPTAVDRNNYVIPGREIYGNPQAGENGYLSTDRNSNQHPVVTGSTPAGFNQAGYAAALKKYQTDLAAFNKQKADLSAFNAQPVQGLQTAQDLTKLPGYNFQLEQGQRAVDSSGAARGMQLSSATLKDLTRFGQGLASGAYQQQLNNLNSLVGVGQNSAALSGAASQNTGNNISSLTSNLGNNIASNQIGAGNAGAAGSIGQANAIGGALSNIGNLGMQGYMLNSMFGGGGGAGAGNYSSTGSFNSSLGGGVGNQFTLGNIGAAA